MDWEKIHQRIEAAAWILLGVAAIAAYVGCLIACGKGIF